MLCTGGGSLPRIGFSVFMKLKPQSRVLTAFAAACLPMPALHLVLYLLERQYALSGPLMGFLMAAVTLLSFGFGYCLMRRKVGAPVIEAHANSISNPIAEPAPIRNGGHADLQERPQDDDNIRERLIKLEQQLFQSQKMEAIGTLASGIAHDFNNMLTAIMGYVELAKLDSNPRSKIRQNLKQALQAANRARELVRQILNFSRKADEKNRPLDLSALIKETLKLLRASIPATIDIRQHLDGDGALVLANATQLHQVLMNLCTNATHAMGKDGGTLTVQLQKSILMGAGAAERGVSPGRYLELTVSDTGPGILPEFRECIFDPYFTTKPQGEGTGLGLAVARSIIQNHGGVIDVLDTPGQGASFRVMLPMTTALPERSQPEENKWPRGSESILLVDDEPAIIGWGQQILSHLGYEVISFNRSDEALEMFRKDPQHFDLVITDVVMPHLTGDLLAAQIHSIRPGIPIIMFTGYSEKTTHDYAGHSAGGLLLRKPLATAELARAIRQVLDNQSSESAIGF
jgi:signal transduction histidine kinase/ActR/RegA family two-component response regulator